MPATLLVLMLLIGGCASTHQAQNAPDQAGRSLYTEVSGDGDETFVFLPGLTGSTAYWKAAGTVYVAGRRLIFSRSSGIWPLSAAGH